MNDNNRRLFITIAMCLAVAYAWSYFFAPKPRPAGAPAQVAQPAGSPSSPGAEGTKPGVAASAAPAGTGAATAIPGTGSSDVPRGTSGKPERPAAPRPPVQHLTLESARLLVILTSDGAAVQSAQLKGDKFRHPGLAGGPAGQVDLVAPEAKILPLSTVVRTDPGAAPLIPADAGYEVVGHDEGSATFRTQAGGLTLTKTFTLDPATYKLGLTVEVKSAAALSGQVAILETGHGEAGGGGSFFSPSRSTPAQAICQAGGKTERIAVGAKTPDWVGPGPAAFVGINQQYFLNALVPPPDSGATCLLEAQPQGLLLATLSLPFTASPAAPVARPFTIFLGPKDTDELSAVAAPLREAVDFGFWSVIASFLLGVMKFFYKAVPPHNWGIAIILLTVAVKVVTFPLQHKSMKSMQEMQRIQPQLEELKKKYAGDTQRQNLEQMKLFKEHGVNPMGSCLPMLIQMPIWLALYTTLQVSVELYNSVFIPGWLVDLTAKDPYYILPVAMGITMILTQVLTPTPMSNPQQKTIGYAMSGFFSLLMLSLPSGLTLYIFVNNILSIAQQIYLRRALRPAVAPA